MKKLLTSAFIFLFLFSACGKQSTPAVSRLSLPTGNAAAETPIPAPLETQTPISSAPAGTPIPVTPTPAVKSTLVPPALPTPLPVDLLQRPGFLSWPLPSYIGTEHIAQYPNTPWTWNYLGLNKGYQCPPMSGALVNNPSMVSYWRDGSIPEKQDNAQADPHHFQIIECYSTGGAAGSNGHAATDILASPETPVYAAADGKVMQWYLNEPNSWVALKHCIGGTWDVGGRCANGKQWYTTYMHILPNKNVLKENMDIPRGTQLGTVLNQLDNSHLHFEVGLDSRSYKNFVNPWGQDQSPWLGCMWLDSSLCTNPDPENQWTLFYIVPEEVLIQQGDSDPIAVRSSQEIKQVRLWGRQILIVDSQNRLWISDLMDSGVPAAEYLPEWKMEFKPVSDFQVTDQRLAVIDDKNNLWVQQIGMGDKWNVQAQNVRAFSISDHRLGYLDTRGDLFVKEGSLQNEWAKTANDAAAFQLVDNRIAVLDRQGNLRVNEGKIDSEYNLMAAHVTAFQLTNQRLGMLDKEDNLWVKDGNLLAAWVLQAKQVKSFQLADNRILMMDEAGLFKLKAGSLYQDWNRGPFTELIGVFMNGQMPVYTR